MKQEDIRTRIAEYNRQLEESFHPGFFTLNKETSFIINQISILQNLCQHEYKDGICIYCGKPEKEE